MQVTSRRTCSESTQTANVSRQKEMKAALPYVDYSTCATEDVIHIMMFERSYTFRQVPESVCAQAEEQSTQRKTIQLGAIQAKRRVDPS